MDRRQFCHPNPAKIVRTAMRLYITTAPQAHAKGIWCFDPKVVHGPEFEHSYEGVLDPCPLEPIDLLVDNPETFCEDVELPMWKIIQKDDELRGNMGGRRLGPRRGTE